jgi:hypothetical protein
MTKNRDDFQKSTVDALGKRSAFICSYSRCRCNTLSPSLEDDSKFIYIGKAAHITAAAKGGARYDERMSSEQRKSIENAIFLCSNCADMIDKNKGVDFPVELLKEWKQHHESWVHENIGLRNNNSSTTINVTSNNQSGGITAAIVNIINPQSYQQPSKNIVGLVKERLGKLKSSYGSCYPKIIIQIESGNSLRAKVAKDLENILQESDLGCYPKGNSFTNQCPEHPITFTGNSENIAFVEKLFDCINPYIKAEYSYKECGTTDAVFMYINGTPSFQPDGSVKIE